MVCPKSRFFAFRTPWLVCIHIAILASGQIAGAQQQLGTDGDSNSSTESMVGSSGYRGTVMGAKVSQPIGLAEEPTGPGGVPWYSTSFNDAGWNAGPLEEVNTVPGHKSKLWRISVRVDQGPLPGAPVKMKLLGDDPLKVYFDGFLLGTYGQIDKAFSANVEVDVADRLAPGMHVIGIRLDNGASKSRMKFQLLDLSTGSPDTLKAGSSFWHDFRGNDAQRKREVIRTARAASLANPKDPDLHRMVIASYAECPVDLCDPVGAERELTLMRQNGVPYSPEDEVIIARATGKLDQIIPALRVKAAETAKWSSGYLCLGDALRDIGDKQGAYEAYWQGIQLQFGNEKFSVSFKTKLIGRLLDLGKVPSAVQQLPPVADRAKALNDGLICNGVAWIYQRLGDRKTADEFYARQEQNAGSKTLSSSDARRVATAFEFGEFERCLALLDAAKQNSEISANDKELLGVIKVRALAELKRPADASQAAGAISWESTDAEDMNYMLHYLEVARAIGSKDQMRAAVEKVNELIRRITSVSKYYRPEPEALIELARANADLGLIDAAKQSSQAVLDAVPDAPLPVNQWERGVALQIRGDRSAGVAALSKAQSLDPKNYWINKDIKESGQEISAIAHP